MIDLLQVAAQIGGIGGLIAIIIFFMYRRDRKDTETRINDVHKAHSERLEHLLEQDQESRHDNTKALTELIILITRLNGRLK